MTRSFELSITDEHGHKREMYKLPYGAELSVADGDAVTGGQMVAHWDPHTHPVVSEVAGRARFRDAVEGVTVQYQTDTETGLTRMVVMDPKQRSAAAKDLRPMVWLVESMTEDVNVVVKSALVPVDGEFDTTDIIRRLKGEYLKRPKADSGNYNTKLPRFLSGHMEELGIEKGTHGGNRDDAGEKSSSQMWRSVNQKRAAVVEFTKHGVPESKFAAVSLDTSPVIRLSLKEVLPERPDDSTWRLKASSAAVGSS